MVLLELPGPRKLTSQGTAWLQINTFCCCRRCFICRPTYLSWTFMPYFTSIRWWWCFCKSSTRITSPDSCDKWFAVRPTDQPAQLIPNELWTWTMLTMGTTDQFSAVLSLLQWTSWPERWWWWWWWCGLCVIVENDKKFWKWRRNEAAVNDSVDHVVI